MIGSRRYFLKSSGLAFVGLGFAPAFLRRALADTPPRRKVLVTIFQRGAVDGLSMVPAVAEPSYYTLRPTIAVPPPDRGPEGAFRLDGHFGLHPALGPLKPFFDRGSLAIVHAVGSPDPTRSHFDAQDYLDAGTPGVKSTPDGWLNRALAAAPERARTPLGAVGLGSSLPRSLAGQVPAIAMDSLSGFRLPHADLARLWEKSPDPLLSRTAGEALEALRLVKEISPDRLVPRNGAVYPASPLGRHLKEIAGLIRADAGLQCAATDCTGWDTHAAQGGATGQLAARLKDLADSLSAFATDLGDQLAEVCVVTMTEFGRTVRENGTRGTDHGHGSVMLALGGSVRGGRVLARWRGLADGDLWQGRDLPVTADHREVLGQALEAHLGVKDLRGVFPRFTPPAERLALF